MLFHHGGENSYEINSLVKQIEEEYPSRGIDDHDVVLYKNVGGVIWRWDAYGTVSSQRPILRAGIILFSYIDFHVSIMCIVINTY